VIEEIGIGGAGCVQGRVDLNELAMRHIRPLFHEFISLILVDAYTGGSFYNRVQGMSPPLNLCSIPASKMNTPLDTHIIIYLLHLSAF